MCLQLTNSFYCSNGCCGFFFNEPFTIHNTGREQMIYQVSNRLCSYHEQKKQDRNLTINSLSLNTPDHHYPIWRRGIIYVSSDLKSLHYSRSPRPTQTGVFYVGSYLKSPSSSFPTHTPIPYSKVRGFPQLGQVCASQKVFHILPVMRLII